MQVPERDEAARRAFEHRDACRAQFGSRRCVDRPTAGWRAPTSGAPDSRRVQRRVDVRPVAVVLLDEIERERGDRHVRVGVECAQPRGEQLTGVRAAPPQIERIGRRQPVSSNAVERRTVAGVQRRERHAESGRRDRRPSCARRRSRGRSRFPCADGRADPSARHSSVSVSSARSCTSSAPVPSAERLPHAVRTGERAGVRGDQLGAAGRARRPAAARRAHRGRPRGAAPRPAAAPSRTVSRTSAITAGRGVVEDVVDVVGGGGDELLPGRHREGVTDRAVGAQQRREHRTGVGDERDGAARQFGPLDVAGRAQVVGDVDESHAARHRTWPCPARCAIACSDARSASPCAAPKTTAERTPAVRRRAQLVLQRRVGDAEQREVGRLGDVGSDGTHGSSPMRSYLRVDGHDPPRDASCA